MVMPLDRRLKLAGVVLAAGVLFVVLYPVQLVLVAAKMRAARTLPHHFWRLVMRILGVRISVIGAPARERPLLLCANHVSWLDIPVLTAVLPISFVAKADVGRWPVIGHLSRLQHTIFIDRTRRAATAETNAEIAERLAGGHALVLFPEGTSSDGTSVLPFRSSLLGGVREAVKRADTADAMLVQPVAIAYTGYRGLPIDRWRRPLYAWYGDMDLATSLPRVLSDGVIEITIAFGEALPMTEASDRKAVTRQLEEAVRRLALTPPRTPASA